VTLFFDDSPSRAVVIFDAGSTLGAFIRVDDVTLLALGDSAVRTFEEAAAALDTVFGDSIGHDGLPQGRTRKSRQYLLYYYYTNFWKCIKLKRIYFNVILGLDPRIQTTNTPLDSGLRQNDSCKKAGVTIVGRRE